MCHKNSLVQTNQGVEDSGLFLPLTQGHFFIAF